MKIVKVSELNSNQILARAVVNENGSILLYEGAELKTEHIEKLIDNNIDEVCVQDTVSRDAKIYTIEAIRQESIDVIKDAVENCISAENEEELGIITETAVNIIKDIVSNVDISNCMLDVKRKSDSLYSHMLSVASLSIVIGIKIGFSEIQLKDVAVGAILHDIGLCDVTVPFFDVEMDRMPAADKLNYRKHVINGYEKLHKFQWMSETAKMIVLSHHERTDGSGYPFHKTSERIPQEVRLVSICDHFDEMVNGIGYKKHKVYEVIEYFRINEAYLFDYDLLTQVMTTVAWFPNNSMVKTNDGETGVVIRQNRGLPDRPVIQIVQTADGTDCTDRNIIKDLTECLTVFITGTAE